ncbi:MAG: cytochrome D1 domain-containing protein, partial [Aestuariivirga sp.]
MTERRHVLGLLAAASFLSISPVRADNLSGGTGDLGLIVERATGSLLVVDRSERAAVGRIEGLGDLSHASLTYSPDERYAYVFGRDGGLTKVDIIACAMAKRVVQAGNAIG